MCSFPRLRNPKSKLSFVVIALLLTFTTAYGLEASHPLHLSWTLKSSGRIDFIFNPEGSINKIVKLDADSNNFITNSLGACANNSACLLQDGKFIQAYSVENPDGHRSLFSSVPLKTNGIEKSTSNTTTILDDCLESRFIVYHYCSTHWNPPAYSHKNGCTHIVNLHSPLRCHANFTNYEHPCYLYDDSGKLIDLTPWILSNGSHYEVEAGSDSSIKSFNLNVCNEATEACGPNVSSCLVDKNQGQIEAGFNNLTSIKYDAKQGIVILTSLGQFNDKCEGKRVKTLVNFICKNHIISKSKPKLIRSSVCENVVEWKTVHACPVSEVKAIATDCKIKYGPLNIEIDLMQLTRNSSLIEVEGIKLDGLEKKMLLGICRGISKDKECEGKRTSATTACLVDSSGPAAKSFSANNSRIVGSVPNSYIRFSDDRLYLESTAVNRSCSDETNRDLKIARQIGTRIEFYCNQSATQDKPTFLGFDDCTYTFEWGSPRMCFEDSPSFSQPQTIRPTTMPLPVNNVSPGSKEKLKSTIVRTTEQPKPQRNPKVDLVDKSKSAQQLHAETLLHAQSIIHRDDQKDIDRIVMNDDKKAIGSHHESSYATKDHEVKPADSVSQLKIQPLPDQPKIGNMYKFIMISLILISLVSFVAVIFILDRKTRLGIPLNAIRRQARQAFQPAPVPYSRVNNFNDSLDL